MTNPDTLLPCPFCGGEAEFNDTSSTWVRCEDCGAETQCQIEKKHAAQLWNRRTPAPQDQMVATSDPIAWAEVYDGKIVTVQLDRSKWHTSPLYLSAPADHVAPHVDRDYPEEFEAWWKTYRHKNRDPADYSVKKQIAFDAFYFGAQGPAPVQNVVGGDITIQPPPNWRPNNKYEILPQTVEEWDWRQDAPENIPWLRSKKRLHTAACQEDPRAPDQMALVLRVDVTRVIHRLTWLGARFGLDKAPDIEGEIARVVQSVNEWDDRTSPDDYPEHLLITSEELADILRNFAADLTIPERGE